MTTNCILAGVGGQGTVLASKLLAQTAIDQGLTVHTAETIGMAQRGGCVVSHVRIGDQLHAPLISEGGADILIGFEPAEAVRSIGLLRPGGHIVVSTAAIVPFTASLSGERYDPADMLAYLAQFPHVTQIDGPAVCRAAGSPRVLNTALLGAAAALGIFPFPLSALEQTMRAFLPERILAVNLEALRCGAAQ